MDPLETRLSKGVGAVGTRMEPRSEGRVPFLCASPQVHDSTTRTRRTDGSSSSATPECNIFPQDHFVPRRSPRPWPAYRIFALPKRHPSGMGRCSMPRRVIRQTLPSPGPFGCLLASFGTWRHGRLDRRSIRGRCSRCG